jgi:phosphatidylserine/phosphatidylglycerophosphate/cardiolipin synthase-like enzyme
MGPLKLLFLEEGAQTAESVARWLADIVVTARVRIDLAIYDCHLEGKAAEILVGALHDRERAGVAIRIVYNQARMPPPGGVVLEPAHPDRTADFIAQSHLPARPVGDPVHGSHLMHHKYLLVDAGTPQARLWTGSANLTTAAFTLQENNLLDLASPELVAGYAADFEELWTTRAITGSGARSGGTGLVEYEGEHARVDLLFAPGQGLAIDHEVAQRIHAASRQVTIASGVVSSGHILGALADVAARRLPLSGIVDLGQMRGILDEWRQVPTSAWKADTFHELAKYGHLHGKRSARSGPAGPHEYMHNKVLVIDDTLVTGSYNYSNNAESNAENVLFIESPAVARAYRAYVEGLVRRYPPV